MSTGNPLTLMVTDPSALAGRLADAFGWSVTQDFGAFAEVRTGSTGLIWLNVPGDPTDDLQQGVIIHYQVPDVTAAADRARAAGAGILREPTVMDFGLESALVQVTDGPIVDLYRPV